MFKYTILLLAFSACQSEVSDLSDTSDTSDMSTEPDVFIPKSCKEFDHNKDACFSNGCNQFNTFSSWCIVNGVCTIDDRPSEVCTFLSPNDLSNSQIAGGMYRQDGDFVIEANTSAHVPKNENWRWCPESDGPDICECFWKGNAAIPGECN